MTGENRTLIIPAGIQNGKLMRLPGLGFKNPSGGPPGDIIVSFMVETPVDLTERQEELLREFAALEAEKKGESTLSRLGKKVRRKLRGALA